MLTHAALEGRIVASQQLLDVIYHREMDLDTHIERRPAEPTSSYILRQFRPEVRVQRGRPSSRRGVLVHR